MSNLNARTDPKADPTIVKKTTADKPPPFRLKPGVFLRAPRLLFKVLRHDPARWQREERSFRNRIKLFKHRTAQAGSLSDKELARLVEDIVDLFRTCLHDGAMYYGLQSMQTVDRGKGSAVGRFRHGVGHGVNRLRIIIKFCSFS